MQGFNGVNNKSVIADTYTKWFVIGCF